LVLAGCKGRDESSQGKKIEDPNIPDIAAIPGDPDNISQPFADSAIDLDPTNYTNYLSADDEPSEHILKELKKVTVKYENGKIKRTCQQKELENGEKQFHGEFSEWWDTGKLWKTGQYIDGVQTGEWKFYNRLGRLTKQGKYVAGRPDGEWVYFRKDGTRQRIESYSNGDRDGNWVEFDSTGEIPIQDLHFLNKQRHGKSTKWYAPQKGDDTRRKSMEIEYSDGRQHGKASEWYESGQLKTEIQFKGGKRHGRAAQWDPSGRLVNEMHFKDGELVHEPNKDSSPEKPQEKAAGD